MLGRLVALIFLLFAGAAGAARGVAASDGEDLGLSTSPNRVLVRSGAQQLTFSRAADGAFRVTGRVRQDGEWKALFDGEAPLVQGAGFDLHPTEYRVIEHSPRRVAVELSGVQPRERYPFSVFVEGLAGSAFLHLRVTCRLPQELILAGLAPQFALWMKQPTLALTVNQGPGNIYRGAAETEWGNSFPAAYLWDAGREAAIFFDMTPMTWMSARNLFRFRDCRAAAFSEKGRSALGLRVVRRNFHELPAGEVVFDAYLYAGERQTCPTRLEALDRLVRLCAPLHPRHGELPVNRKAPHRTSWEGFAAGVSRNLQLKEVTWTEVPLPQDRPWRDEPFFPEDTVNRLRVSCDYAVESACEPRFNRTHVLQGWDFSTCNNYLSGWIGYERLNPNPDLRQFLAEKEKALPLFYDPKAGMIRHGTRHPLNLGDREMSWQNLMFALETVRTYRMLPPEVLRPAIPGRFLMGADGLIELAHKNSYLLPQWFDPYRKTPIFQGDEPDLGIIYEPWQIGTYCYLMGEAYAITGEKRYLNEARAGLDRLFGGMKFKVSNHRYQSEYADPVDFPITEIFGNAWGAAGAMRVYRWTGDARYRKQSDHFLNSLLRMTYWYESNLRGDPRDRALRNAGLFRNHSGAFTGSPWETSEAYLAMTVRLKLDREVREPLPRLFNLLRLHGFYYFPPVFPDAAVPCARLADHPADYLPIEDTYTLEHGGANGSMGRCVYMSGIAFWNYLLFEALASFDDPRLMALSLDVIDDFEGATASLQRSFLVYNPELEERTASLRMRFLAEGSYRVTVRRKSGETESHTLSAARLRDGFALRLRADEHARVKLSRLDAAKPAAAVRQAREARDALAIAYRQLQGSARPGELPAWADVARQAFREAEAAYRNRRYRLVIELARQAGEHTRRAKPAPPGVAVHIPGTGD